MIFKKLRTQRYINNNIKENLEFVLHKLEDIRKQSPILAICPKPTGYNWKGINLAAKNLFNNQTFEIAQYFSSSVYNFREIKTIVSFIDNLKFSQIIFNGFPPYFEQFIEEVYSKNRNIKIGIIFYGYLNEMRSDNNGFGGFQIIADLLKNKKVHKIAFNKKGVSETIKNIINIPSSFIVAKNTNVDYQPQKRVYSGIQIGVLGDNSFRKNLHNQVCASLLISGATVHVIDKSEFDYLGDNSRIIGHGKIEKHQSYLDLLSSMDINLYISYSESWGMVTTDSLSMGIPCLISSSGIVYDWDNELKQLLTVVDYDNSLSISKQIEKVLSESIDANRLKSYVRKLNNISDELLKDFLNL